MIKYQYWQNNFCYSSCIDSHDRAPSLPKMFWWMTSIDYFEKLKIEWQLWEIKKKMTWPMPSNKTIRKKSYSDNLAILKKWNSKYAEIRNAWSIFIIEILLLNTEKERMPEWSRQCQITQWCNNCTWVLNAEKDIMAGTINQFPAARQWRH